MASIAAHHAEWLSLVDVSGPFLSVPVLKEALPNGLDAHDPHVAAEVRAALEQWADPDGDGWGSVDEGEIHQAFVRFVLHEVLGFGEDTLRWDDAATSATTIEVPQVGVLTPDAVVMDGEDAVMLVAVVGPGVRVDQITSGSGTLSPQERMVEHLKASGLRVGLVTDGERWTLVSYREGENPGFATWWSSLWGEEKITLQAFRTLLHQDRFLTMGSDETIVGLLDRSAENQREVTTKLGNQTLRAVEILIRTIDRIDHERGGELLRDVPVAELYDAAVTVMMRLIFLFYAEENDLLPVAEPLYNERYAASTLRERLQAAADHHGEEVLETTHDGWPRLLATWRAVFGGVEHGDMVLAPYGGSLFDPDRYPFLEGRRTDTSWSTEEADPLPVDNRTVLHLLNALQTLDEGGQRRKLSFRALDVEQIGHVYEGMLDHTAARAEGWVLGLSGTGGQEPEIEVDHLESLDDKALFDFLKEQTGRSPATLKKWVSDDEADKAITKFGITWSATFADSDLEARARRFAKLIRPDSTGAPTVFQPGSVYVADSSHRGATGTHYTPRSLTEEIVKHTLDPLVYVGPADGVPEDEWELRSPQEILDLKICDPACGSGAFLVQACRYLAGAVVEANRTHQRRSDPITEDEIIDARRQVAERCLHGVDINPMACEMAKLSLWLITLARDRPFTFLDHAIRNGDSLLGITSIQQLSGLDIEAGRGEGVSQRSITAIDGLVERQFAEVRKRAGQISALPTNSFQDVHLKELLSREIHELLAGLELIASAVCAARLYTESRSEYQALMLELGDHLRTQLTDMSCAPLEAFQSVVDEIKLSHGYGVAIPPMVHWPIWRCTHSGEPLFDAIIANPPFLGGTRIVSEYGDAYSKFLATIYPPHRRKADLCAYFVRLATEVVGGRELLGSIGMITTTGLADASSVPVGLGHACNSGWEIVRAHTSLKWPGTANVSVNLVWLSNDKNWVCKLINGVKVEAISPRLESTTLTSWTPVKLSKCKGHCFVGSKVWGEGRGFYVSAYDANRWIAINQRNSEVVVPAYTGSAINSTPDMLADRYIINFKDMPLAQASSYYEPFDHLQASVKEWRQSQDPRKYSRAIKYWWQYFHPRHGLYSGIKERGLKRVLARAEVSARHIVDFLPVGPVYMHKVVVFLFDDFSSFGVLQSTLHSLWWEAFGKGRGTSPNYVPSGAFETFPWPIDIDSIAVPAREFWELRCITAQRRRIGRTELASLVENPRENSQDIIDLRESGVLLNQAVTAAYGWTDLDPEQLPVPGTSTEGFCGFGPFKDRLLELNREHATSSGS